MSQSVDASRIPELRDIVAFALQQARNAGAAQAEADVSLQQGLNVTVRLGEVETIEYQRDRALGITVYFNGAKGSASSADLRPDAVRAMVAKACSIAQFTARDEFAGLADAGDMAREVPISIFTIPGSSLPRPPLNWPRPAKRPAWRWMAGSPTPKARRCPRIVACAYYGNTHGFLAGYPSTSHSISCALLHRMATTCSATTGTPRRARRWSR